MAVWLRTLKESAVSVRPSQILFWWFTIILSKYLILTLASQWAWSGDYSYFNNIFLAVLLVPAFGGAVFAIMDRMGLSLIEAMSSGQSDDKYIVTTYDGKVERGFFGDTVKVTPKHRETSDRAEMAGNMLFAVVIFDALCFYFGWIQSYLPFLQVF